MTNIFLNTEDKNNDCTMQRLSYMSNPRLQPYRYSSIVDIFSRNLAKFPKKEIFIHRRENGDRKSITNEDLDEKSTQFAKFLYSVGIKRGTHVGIFGPNTIEWVIGELAILKTGAVSVHLSSSTNEGEDAMDVLAKANCRHLIVDPGIDMEMEKSITILMEKILQRNKQGSEEISLIQLRSITGYENIASLSDIVVMNLDVKLPFIFPEDPAIVFTTSGSTGSPKMIQYSHFSLVGLGNIADEIYQTSEKKFFNDRPFGWLGGTPIFSFLDCTARVFTDTAISVRGTNPEYIWNVIKAEGCTGAVMMPFSLHDFCKLKENNRENFLIPLVITGGNIIDDCCRKAIGLVCEELKIGYGSTEGGSVLYSVDKNIPIKTGICGKPTQGMEIKLIDSDKNTLLTGEQGEVCVRSRLISQGYFNDPTKNEQLFLDGGWLRMGDIGYIDGNGDLVIIGRLKDIISRGGRKILPCMIEDKIKKMSGIREVVVVPVPDKRLSEEVCVCFTNDSNITTADVKKFCEETFIKDETLDGKGESPTYFLRVDEMPMLVTGKVNKQRLKEIAAMKFNLS